MLMLIRLCLCASENSIRQISGFVLLMFLLMLTLRSRVFSLVMLMLCLCGSENQPLTHSKIHLKYTWEISENSVAFLDVKLSINDNGLSTSVHYKPTDSHNYWLHSFPHPQHIKDATPFSQFLRLRRLCSEDSDFNKCKEMCHFFKKRGYPDSSVTTGKHCAQEIDRETALQTSQNEENNRLPFTHT